nr:Toll-like receptor protein [Mimachlamys nobilis]
MKFCPIRSGLTPETRPNHDLTNTSFRCTSEENCTCHRAKDAGIVADCSHLNIDFVPRFHPNVTIIYLQGNRLKTFSGEGIPNSITFLDLSGNKLESFIGFRFKHMVKLEYLNLNDNRLQYTKEMYNRNIFQGLSSLKELNIKRNNMELVLRNLKFPVSISQLQSLEKLLIDGVDLVGFDESFNLLTKLRTVDLSGKTGVCHLGTIRSGFFQNVSGIANLDISDCDIHMIELGTFRILKSLHKLNVSSNECLTFRVLSNITNDIQYTPTRILDLSKLHCTFGPSTVIQKDDIEHLRNSNITHLYVNHNRLALLESGTAKELPKNLTFLSVSDNKLSFGLWYIELMSGMPNIEIIHAEHQGSPHNLQSGSSDCNDWRAPPSPHNMITFGQSAPELHDCNRNPLKKVNHDKNVVTQFSFPLSLKEFYYSNNAMNFEIGRIVFTENNIRVFDLSNNLFYSWRGPLVNLNRVQYIDFSNNYCSYISEYLFPRDNDIRTLLVGNNLLGLVLYKDTYGNIFRNWTRLELLDLSRNHIYSLPTPLLKSQGKMRILNLSNNALSEFSLDLSNMKQLEYLDLSHNQLRTIKPEQRDQIDNLRVNNVTLNLEGNRMDCSCEQLEYLKWLAHNRDIFVNFLRYECEFPNGTQITFSNFDIALIELTKSCASYIVIIAVFGSMIVLSISLTISGIVYRYRWKLRYVFYMARIRRGGYTPVVSAMDDDDYEWDAFVSYCSSDYQFVLKHVITNLENNEGLKLCLHQRDFVPGEEIAKNITNAIHQSRKTVVLLSRKYLDSYWCTYEFNMARMESIYSRGGNPVLLLVFYENIPARELPFTMMDLIEHECYTEYPHDDKEGQIVFWDKLAKSISPYPTTNV